MLGRFFARYRLALGEARFFRAALLCSVAVNLATWFLAARFVVPRLATSPFLALHYTVYFGVDFIGPPWRLGSPPLLGTCLLLLNAAVASWLYVRERLASAFMMALTLLLESILFVTTFLVVLLNT